MRVVFPHECDYFSNCCFFPLIWPVDEMKSTGRVFAECQFQSFCVLNKNQKGVVVFWCVFQEIIFDLASSSDSS